MGIRIHEFLRETSEYDLEHNERRFLEQNTIRSMGYSNARKDMQPLCVHLINIVPLTRSTEFISILQRNLLHPFICRVHLLSHNTTHEWLKTNISTLVEHEKISIQKLNRGTNETITFADIFKWCELFFAKSTPLVILSIDPFIYFDSSLSQLSNIYSHYVDFGQYHRRKHVAYFISRRATLHEHLIFDADSSLDIDQCGGPAGNDYRGSHSVIVFSAPLIARSHEFLNFTIPSGDDLCDNMNRVMTVFRNHGYRVLNPCYVINVFRAHFYVDNVRRMELQEKMNHDAPTCADYVHDPTVTISLPTSNLI